MNGAVLERTCMQYQQGPTFENRAKIRHVPHMSACHNRIVKLTCRVLIPGARDALGERERGILLLFRCWEP